MRDNDDEGGRGGISKNLELFWRDLAVTGPLAPFVRCSSLENDKALHTLRLRTKDEICSRKVRIPITKPLYFARGDFCCLHLKNLDLRSSQNFPANRLSGGKRN